MKSGHWSNAQGDLKKLLDTRLPLPPAMITGGSDCHLGLEAPTPIQLICSEVRRVEVRIVQDQQLQHLTYQANL